MMRRGDLYALLGPWCWLSACPDRKPKYNKKQLESGRGSRTRERRTALSVSLGVLNSKLRLETATGEERTKQGGENEGGQ